MPASFPLMDHHPSGSSSLYGMNAPNNNIDSHGHDSTAELASLALWFFFWQSLGGLLWLALSQTSVPSFLANATRFSGTASAAVSGWLTNTWAGRIYYTISAVVAGWHLRSFVDSRNLFVTNDRQSSSKNSNAKIVQKPTAAAAKPGVANTLAPAKEEAPREAQPSPSPSAATEVTKDDLGAFMRTLDGRDDEGAWAMLMTRNSRAQRYVACRRDPASGGSTQYYSTTTTHGVKPLDVVHFYYDDARRLRWDDLLRSARRIDGTDPVNGADVVYWERRFPVCSNRDYVIARRTFRVGETYYCVTKGVTHASCPTVHNLWRVTEFFSCWRVREVPWDDSGSMAVETTLFHTEELGLPRSLAKLAVKVGMPTFVGRIEPSLRELSRKRAITSGAMLAPAPSDEAEYSSDECDGSSVCSSGAYSEQHPVSVDETRHTAPTTQKWLRAGMGVTLALLLSQQSISGAIISGVLIRWRNRRNNGAR